MAMGANNLKRRQPMCWEQSVQAVCEKSKLTARSLIPQIWTNWRTKKTDGLPGLMMFLWALCGLPFGVYAVAQNFNIPLQVQPQVFIALCLISWAQILLYHRNWPAWKASLLGLAVAAVFAGVEAALILTLKFSSLPGSSRHTVFLAMDWSGAFFSLMALVTQNTFDVLGGVLYIVCCALEIGIVSSHLIWLARTRKIRKAAAIEGKTFDDIAAEHEIHGIPFKFAERKGQGLRLWGSGSDKKMASENKEMPTGSGEVQMQPR
ncbi:hypothetical protein B0I37DRAFT_423223 [Chaetomium sp. MPI-CAGE-AT-0009]|nr:hypothetical protein B0I37DRAFT_423223 [Chaetomium sp. MPI-CAGE-AT-0009]